VSKQKQTEHVVLGSNQLLFELIDIEILLFRDELEELQALLSDDCQLRPV